MRADFHISVAPVSISLECPYCDSYIVLDWNNIFVPKELKYGFIFYVTDFPENKKCTACYWIDYGDGIRFRGGGAVAIPENIVN